MENLKLKLKAITRKTTPATFDERIIKLKEVQQGWLQYYRMASIQENSKTWTAGYAIDCAAVSGNNGRNLNDDGKT